VRALARVCIPATPIDLLIYLFSARAPRAVPSNFFSKLPRICGYTPQKRGLRTIAKEGRIPERRRLMELQNE